MISTFIAPVSSYYTIELLADKMFRDGPELQVLPQRFVMLVPPLSFEASVWVHKRVLRTYSILFPASRLSPAPVRSTRPKPRGLCQ